MANYIPNKNLSEESKLRLKEEILKISLQEDVRKLLEFLREKYNLSIEDEFDCPYFQQLDKDYKTLVKIQKKLIDLLPESDW